MNRLVRITVSEPYFHVVLAKDEATGGPQVPRFLVAGHPIERGIVTFTIDLYNFGSAAEPVRPPAG